MSSSASSAAWSTASRCTFMMVSTSAVDVALGRPRAPSQQRGAPTSSTMRRPRRVERRHAERHVLEHLDEHAAEPEHHHRPEQLVVAHADDALDAARRPSRTRARRRVRPARSTRPRDVVAYAPWRRADSPTRTRPGRSCAADRGRRHLQHDGVADRRPRLARRPPPTCTARRPSDGMPYAASSCFDVVLAQRRARAHVEPARRPSCAARRGTRVERATVAPPELVVVEVRPDRGRRSCRTCGT